jgi:uncharacterized membrane protein YtjA (UPF0391 family)
MLYYSFIFAVVGFVTGTLAFIGPGRATASVMKLCFAASFLLLTISLGRRQKAQL